jgi:hypothetical protein
VVFKKAIRRATRLPQSTTPAKRVALNFRPWAASNSDGLAGGTAFHRKAQKYIFENLKRLV